MNPHQQYRWRQVCGCSGAVECVTSGPASSATSVGKPGERITVRTHDDNDRAGQYGGGKHRCPGIGLPRQVAHNSPDGRKGTP